MMIHPNLSFILFLLFTLFLHHFVAASATPCHKDDENGLLAFKSGLVSDPSGMLKSWQPGTDCCSWAGIQCRPESNNRVITLYLYGEGKNILSGPISSSLSKLQYLNHFVLRDLGNLTGPFPGFLFSIPNISTISITNSKLSGPIPRNIPNLTNLQSLELSGNQFSGRIPSQLVKLTQLGGLLLDGNRLSGTIPVSFGRLKTLSVLDLSRNQLTGCIPDIFSGMTYLNMVRLSNNNFSGTIPKSLCILSLIIVNLAHNALTGQIPDCPKRSGTIIELNLSWNQLSGVVPRSLGSVGIVRLDFSHNNLNGSFPELIMQFDIGTLDLSYNDYHFGVIPKWIGNKSIDTLKLARCGITMKLNEWKPTGFYANIDLSENGLTGSPLQLLKSEMKTRLLEFRASHNKLKFDMKHMKIGKNLKVLDLSNNLVFGNVPKTVKRLQELNVSHNHLCGQLPPTKFPTSAFLNNDCLCGAPLPHCKV